MRADITQHIGRASLFGRDTPFGARIIGFYGGRMIAMRKLHIDDADFDYGRYEPDVPQP